MKFSYHWIRELVPGLDTDPAELMRLITMKTAECEGLEHVGAALADASVARVKEVEFIPESHNRIAVVETARYGTKTSGVRRAELPAGHADRVSVAGAQSGRWRGERRNAGQRRWSWASSSDHAGIVELESEAMLGARHHHRSGQQVAHASAGFVGPSRHGARSSGDYASQVCATL